MTKKSKRRQAHKNRPVMAKAVTSVEILDKGEKQLNNEYIEATRLCLALGLHKEFRFGKKRCCQVLKAVDDYMAPWMSGECNIEGLRDLVNKKIGELEDKHEQ